MKVGKRQHLAALDSDFPLHVNCKKLKRTNVGKCLGVQIEEAFKFGHPLGIEEIKAYPQSRIFKPILHKFDRQSKDEI